MPTWEISHRNAKQKDKFKKYAAPLLDAILETQIPQKVDTNLIRYISI